MRLRLRVRGVHSGGVLVPVPYPPTDDRHWQDGAHITPYARLGIEVAGFQDPHLLYYAFATGRWSQVNAERCYPPANIVTPVRCSNLRRGFSLFRACRALLAVLPLLSAPVRAENVGFGRAAGEYTPYRR